MKGLILGLLLCANLLPSWQDQVRVGNLKFDPPKDWKATPGSGRDVAIYAPPNVPAGKTCTVKVFPEEFDKDGFRPWFNRRWNRTVTGGHQMLRMSEMASQKVSGVDVLMRSGAYKVGDGEGYILVIGLSVKDKFICVWYESNDFSLMESHQNEVYDMFDSFEFIAGGAGQPDKPGGNPPIGTTPPTKPPTGNQPPTGNPNSNPIPGGAPSFRTKRVWVKDPSGPFRIARLAEIAQLLQNPKSDANALTSEAVRLCGFSIWREDHSKVFEPLNGLNLHLAVTDHEIATFSRMFRKGHRVGLKDLASSIDAYLARFDPKLTCGPSVVQWLSLGEIDGDPSIRAMTSFLNELGAARKENKSLNAKSELAILDPIQALLILRVVSEDLAKPLQRDIDKYEMSLLMANTNPLESAQGLGGWADDAYNVTLSTLSDNFWNALELGREATRTTADFDRAARQRMRRAQFNLLIKVVKFIATYASLTVDVKAEAPGAPLIRTKDLYAGEVRTLAANVRLELSKTIQSASEFRPAMAFFGLDIDLPQNGALKNVETFWMVDQSIYPSKQLIRGVQGGGGLDRVRTNDNGVARVKFEGSPQQRKMNPSSVIPIKKSVRVIVTPQVKPVEMKQDIVDAVDAALGIGTAWSFAPEVLMEMLYRLKWGFSGSLDLEVTDWVEYESIGDFSMDVSGIGIDEESTPKTLWYIGRRLTFSNVGMTVTGGKPDPIDPRFLNSLPPAERKQVEEGLKQAALVGKNKKYLGEKPGHAYIYFGDRKFMLGSGACEEEDTTTTTTWNGKYDNEFVRRAPDKTEMLFQIEVDKDAKTVTLIPLAGLLVHIVTVIKKDSGASQTIQSDEMLGMFGGLKFYAPYESNKPIVIPLKEDSAVDKFGYRRLTGNDTIKFTYGPENKFNGTIDFSYTLNRKYK